MNELATTDKTNAAGLRAVLNSLTTSEKPGLTLPRSVPLPKELPKELRPQPVSLSAQIVYLEEELAQAKENRDSYKLTAALHEQENASLRQRLGRETARAEHMTRKFTALKTLLEAFVHFQTSGGAMLADAMSRAERDFYGESSSKGEAVRPVAKVPEVDFAG
jgi:hypothetical protein